jgi:hypothetical protein
MNQAELDILHKLPDSILSIHTSISNSVDIEYLRKFAKYTTLHEYHVKDLNISKVYDDIQIEG